MYKIFDAETRRYVEIDLDEAELVPGMIITRFFRFAGRFVTIPGASLFVVNADLQLEAQNG